MANYGTVWMVVDAIERGNYPGKILMQYGGKWAAGRFRYKHEFLANNSKGLFFGSSQKSGFFEIYCVEHSEARNHFSGYWGIFIPLESDPTHVLAELRTLNHWGPLSELLEYTPDHIQYWHDPSSFRGVSHDDDMDYCDYCSDYGCTGECGYGYYECDSCGAYDCSGECMPMCMGCGSPHHSDANCPLRPKMED